MKQQKRKYISVYFDDRPLTNLKKRDLTIAFNPSEPLYKHCKDLGSSDVKQIIGISSYEKLVKKAQGENRTLSNYIKNKLREKLL